MKLLESTALSQMCDYSFGDQSGVINGIYNSWMTEANSNNLDFIKKYNETKKERNYMTVFIDNIRLYNRNITFVKDSDRNWVNDLMSKNDLLKLCSSLPDINFIIFTGNEDTPIDNYIFDQIPKNVLGIYASNALAFGDKVHPIPYGLQRVMHPNDNRLNIIQNYIIKNENKPSKLLYINHSISHNTDERGNIHHNFLNKDWATINIDRIDYNNYLKNIQDHKFMICPYGNAIDCDCHRNWEVLYMRRVPVMKRCNYLEYIFKDFPVLFVDSYSDITEELLLNSNYIFDNALKLDFKTLDLEELFNKIIKSHDII